MLLRRRKDAAELLYAAFLRLNSRIALNVAQEPFPQKLSCIIALAGDNNPELWLYLH